MAPRIPGTWLLAAARLLFDRAVIDTIMEPAIGDMRSEWLDAGASQRGRFVARLRGYLAFWALVLMAPFTFEKTSWRLNMTRFGWIRLVGAFLILGLASGYAVSRFAPVLYRSSALVQVVPPRVPDGVLGEMRPASEEGLASRLRFVESVMLSRTRLEHMIKEFNLYPSEVQSMIMEDVVALMRRRIDLGPVRGDAFRISYWGSDPTTVMKVTEKIAGFFIEESLKNRQRRAEGTLSFLEARISETAARLAAASLELERAGNGASATPKRIELDVIQTTYKSLLTRREEAFGMRDLERRQIGEQFILLDPAQVPQRPIGPPRFTFVLMGGASGLAAALLFAIAAMIHRTLSRRRQFQTTAT